MTSSDFTLDLAFSLFVAEKEAEEQNKFSVSFEDAWQWIGYGRRDTAKKSFANCDFINGEDFEIHRNVDLRPQGGIANREDIFMTVECFKSWGMAAGTEKGKEIRKYFIACEKKYKELKKKYEEDQKQQKYKVEEFIQKHARIYKPEFPKEFYDELYRVTGYSKPKRGKNPYMAILVREYIYGMFGQEVLDEIDRVNPIVGYHTYNVPKATPKQISSIKAQIRGNKQAAKHYLEKGKIGKSKKAQKKVEQLERRLVRWSKPHSLRLPKREFMHHQFCSDLIGLPSLQAHVQTVITVMRTLPSDDTDRFHEAMESAFPNGALKNVSSIILDIPLISA